MVGCCWLWSSLLLSHWHVNGCFIFSFSVTVELCLCFSSTAVPVQRTKRGIQSLGENVKRKKKFTDELLMRRKINHVRNFAKGLRSMSTGKRINKYHVVLLHIAMIQRCGQFSGFSVRKGQKIIIFELCVCTSRPAFLPKSVNYLNAWAQQRHGKRWIFVLPWKTRPRFTSVYVPFIFKKNMNGWCLATSAIW